MSELKRKFYTRPAPAGAAPATLQGKPAVRFLDKSGKPVVAPLTASGGRVRLPVNMWYGEYLDAAGVRLCEALSPNKDAAKKMLRDIEARVQLERAGLVTPLTGHRKTPLATHLDDWLAALAGRGRSAEYVALKRGRVVAALDGCNALMPADLSAETLERFLAKLKASGGRSTQTVNDYLQAVKQFAKWLAENGRLERSPFASVRKGNAERDRRHVRRPLTQSELARLIDAAHESAVAIRGLTGPDRAMLYRVCALTGYRAGEAAALAPENFDLARPAPAVTLSAAFTKNGKAARQPIPAELAADLAAYVAGKPPGKPVWPGTWHERPTSLFHKDAAAAGIPRTTAGPDGELVTDFHALRATFITMLDTLNVGLKARMTLARHSDPRLTMNRYTGADAGEIGGAAGMMPSLAPTRPKVATGETPARADRFPPLSPGLFPEPGKPCGSVTTPDKTSANRPVEVSTTQPLVSKGFDDVCGAMRTGDDGDLKEPLQGFGPWTPALRKRCSTTELKRQHDNPKIPGSGALARSTRRTANGTDGPQEEPPLHCQDDRRAKD